MTGSQTEATGAALLRFPAAPGGDIQSLPAQLEAYWTQLRGARAVPTRAEIDPRGIERLLPYAFVLERIAPGLARFRLSGGHLNDLMGMDVRGMPLTTMLEPAAREAIIAPLETAFRQPATLRVSLSSPRGLARPGIEAQMAILPLADELGRISKAIGCLVSDAPIGRAPRRFGLTGTTVTPIETSRPVRPNGATPNLRLVHSRD